jgi:hypothetical protein
MSLGAGALASSDRDLDALTVAMALRYRPWVSGHEAARFARDAATDRTALWRELSALMCWDAVARCMELAGRPVRPRHISGNTCSHVISIHDQQITDRGTMQGIPQGSFIGFFDGGRLIHAMIAVGFGMAAGNKNACINLGSPVGWEILNLADDLDWGNVGARHLSVHYRAI